MKAVEFEKRYSDEYPKLVGLKDELNTILRAGIKNYWNNRSIVIDSDRPRIRLQEARVKDVNSLYRKINNDRSKLRFNRAFDPSHVRDLVAARFVCPNLQDMHEIAKSIKTNTEWEVLRAATHRSTRIEKKWIEEGEPHSGYRGWHLDVTWESNVQGCDFGYAELQLRTILQDAWATFMHDDVYKADASNIFPQKVLTFFSYFSDILYKFDLMADEIRNDAYMAQVSQDSAITILDAYEQHMYTLGDSVALAGSFVHYESINRKDEYQVLESGNGKFIFEFHGVSSAELYFAFPLVGDTSFKNTNNLKVERLIRENWHDVTNKVQLRDVEGSQYDENSRVVIVTDRTRKRKNHSYRISIDWAGVFEHQTDAIWCPWLDIYPSAGVDYQLVISYEVPPRCPPVFVDVGTPNLGKLSEIVRLFRSGGLKNHEILGRSVTKLPQEAARYEYSAQDLRANSLCLIDVPPS